MIGLEILQGNLGLETAISKGKADLQGENDVILTLLNVKELNLLYTP